MAIEFTYRSISQWPGPRTGRRQRSRFKTAWHATEQDLRRELRHLGARSVVIELDLPESQIRLDGLPYAKARPATPGVILSFESRHGPLRYPSDNFDDWRDNVRAIALALEALRKVDRYGVTRHAEQYRGWAALPAPPEPTVQDAAELLAQFAGNGTTAAEILRNAAAFAKARKTAMLNTHPDRHEGRDATFKAVNAAAATIAKHHGAD